MNTLLIARHGNTFDPGDQIVRVGCKTDLPLSQSGIRQAVLLGKYLKQHNLNLAAVFTSTLKRTVETANIMLEHAKQHVAVTRLKIFDEIDYGPDEGKPEATVIARIGETAMQAWNTEAIVPPGWIVEPSKIIQAWQEFAAESLRQYPRQTVCVITSNGIARFAPYLTKDFAAFTVQHDIKLGTGCVASLSYRDSGWSTDYWNVRPGE